MQAFVRQVVIGLYSFAIENKRSLNSISVCRSNATARDVSRFDWQLCNAAWNCATIMRLSGNTAGFNQLQQYSANCNEILFGRVDPFPSN